MKRLLHSALLAFVLAFAAAAGAQVSFDGTKTGSDAPFAGTFTWAGKPACTAALSGSVARISDVGPPPGLRVMCDGSGWRVDGVQVLARSAIGWTVTGSTSETTLATVTVPGGVVGPNGSLRVTALWSMTSSANNKNARIKLGGTSFMDYTYTTTASHQTLMIVRNRNSLSSQVANNLNTFGLSSTGVAVTTAAIDSSVDQSLTLTFQLALGTESGKLEGYTVELLP